MARFTSLLAAIAALTLVATAVAADVTLSIDELEAELDGDVVEVDGDLSATFEAKTATDATGDALMVGTDVETLSIEQVDFSTSAFSVTLADAIPVVGSVPGVVHWFWDFTVNGNEQKLTAMHTNVGSGTPGEWYFASQTCAPDPSTGQNTCASSELPGSYVDGVITWMVPNASLGLAKGGKVGSGSVSSTPGAAGLIWLSSGGSADLDSALIGSADLLFPEVTLTGYDADGAETGSTVGNVRSSGRFDAELPAGTTVVEAEACMGEVCVTSTTAVVTE